MPVRDDNIGKSIQIESSKPSSKRNVQKDKRNKKKQKNVSRKYTIVGNVVSLQAGQDNPVNKITSDLVGATLSVTNPHTLVDTNRYPSTRYTLPTTYSTTISKVINETTFEVSEPYYVTDDTLQKIPVSLKQGSISITYDTYKTETENSVFQRSFAELTIGNLRTFSGDVYKAKIYTRDSHTSTDFEEIYDTFVVPENILVDSTSINGYENIGFFHTGSIIANNWVSSSTNTETEPFISLNNEKLIDGVQISGSTQNLEDKVTFRTQNSFDLEQSVDYVVRFNSYYFKSISKRRDDNDDVSDVNHASLKIYLSGSAITGQNGEEDFFLGEVDVPDSLGDEGSIPDVVGRFRTAGSGSPKAWLKFELNSGRFIVQDVSIEPFSETNFNPSFFKVLAPMPKAVRRGDKYDFLVEFYDSNNNIAETTAQVNGITFQGPRQVISDGLDGVLSGSLLIGQSLEMYGVNPAYLRSVGYDGFDNTISNNKGGFMLFSGSVGTRITASESYEGVGLEIVDAHSDIDRYLKFRTNPSQFEVVTDTFFFGRDGQFISGSGGTIAISSSNFFLGDSNGAFISGSQGNLQISSSNFSVDVDGNVTMSGFVSASGGHIGNFQIVEGKISGSNITMDANTSTIFKTDQGPGSDPQAPGFESQADEYYIDFTPTEESPDNYYIKFGPNFMVDKDGILIASGATFVGTITASAGLLGGFTIGSASLFNGSEGTPNFFFSGSANGSNFDKGNLFISSSGFQVNSQGAISASSGQIGGWTLSNTTLANGTDIVLDSSNKRISINDSTFGNAGVQLEHDTGTGKFYAGDGSSKFIQFDGSDVNIQSDDFLLSTSTLIIDSGTSNGVIKLGTSATNITETANTGVYIDGNGKFRIGTATSGTDYLHFDGSSIDIKTQAFELETNNLDISSTNERIDLGDGKIILQGAATSTITIGASDSIVLSDNGTDRFIKFGDKTDFAQTGTEGLIMGTNNGNAEFDMTIGAGNNNYLRADSSGIDIATPNFELNTLPLDISSTNKRIQIFDALGTTEYIRIGEISYDAATKYGIQVWDGNGTDSATDLIAMFGQAGNKIAGWNFTGTQIRTEPAAGLLGSFAEGEKGLIIHSDGKIETADFVSNLKGWRIDEGGFAEFESARIRGTLKTAVFEKESVNAVGGQLMIANSTTLEPLRDTNGNIVLGYDEISNTFPTMSCPNVSGFSIGEILKAKKINDTGFSVEYLKISGIERYSTHTSAATQSIYNGITDINTIDPDGLFGELHFEVNGSGNRSIIGFDPSSASDSSPSGSAAKTTLSTSTINTTVTSFNVADASDFSVQDIIKIGNAKTDERMKITAISSNTLTVIRDWGGTTAQTHASSDPVWLVDTDKEFLMGLVSTPVSYNSGQVIVSTGKYDAAEEVSTGYILLNANPNDPSTPYMDIVERTGSGVYDLQLRSRLGDLSGLSSAYLYGDDEPGFGLYTENGFFKGSITADTGSIAGILNVATTQGGLETGQKITIGRNIGNTKRLDTQASQTGQHDGFRINENNYWLTTAEFRIGNDNNYLHISGTEASQASQFKINTKELEVKVDGTNGRSLHDLEISSAETSMSFSDRELVLKAGTYGGTNENAGFIQVGDNRAIEITGSNNLGVIRSKKTSFTDDTAGFWLANDNGTQEFYIGTATEHLKFNGSVISLAGDNISLTADNVDVTTGTFEVDADDFQLSSTNKSASFGYDTTTDSGITITAGSTNEILFGSKTSPDMKLHSDGTDAFLSIGTIAFGSETNAGILIGNDNGNAELRLYKDADEFFTYDATAGFDLRTTSFRVNTTGLDISGTSGTGTSNFLKLGSATTVDAGEGFYVDGGGNFRVGTATSGTDFMKFTPSGDLVIKSTDIDITSTAFNLDATELYISSANQRIALGADGSTLGYQGTGIFLGEDGSGIYKFSLKSATGDSLSWNGGAGGTGQLDITGNITADSGNIGGWTINSTNIEKDGVRLNAGSNNGYLGIGITSYNTNNGIWIGETSSGLYQMSLKNSGGTKYFKWDGTNLEVDAGNFSLDSSGNITATSVDLTGEIKATTGVIGGWNINGTTLESNDQSIVLDEGNNRIDIVGTTTVGGSSVDTKIRLDADAGKGSEIALQRDDFGGSLINFVELHTSQSYFENNIGSYVSGSTRDNKDFTRDANDSEIVLMSGAGAGAWGSSVYLRSDGSDLDDILIENTISAGQLLDTGETNLITEIQLQNLTERAGAGSGKSLFRWKGEVFQNETNSTTGAELVGSFRISSVLSLSAAASSLNIPSKFLLTKRYFYVKITGTDYDVLTGSGVESWTLDSSGTDPQIRGTKYLPRVITSGIGQQFFAGPNQEAKFGAKNEVIGNFKVKETLAGTAGDIVAEGKMSVGTFDIDDTFDLFVDGAIGATGNIVGFYSSDKRLKENIVEIKDGLSLINQLRPVKFDWKQDSPFGHLKPTEYGLIAQEVQEVIPEIVGHMKDDYKGINYEKIVPLLISSIQQLTKRVEELEQDK